MSFALGRIVEPDAGTAPDAAAPIIEFLSGFSTETTPAAAAKVQDFRGHLRPGTSVFVSFLQGGDFADTIAAAAQLRRQGFNPVPHIAARGIPDRAFLEDGLRRLRDEADVTEALVIAGAAPAPAGTFSDSMQILETGLLDKHGITRIAVSGHPEGSPDIGDEAIAEALRWKNAFAERTGAHLTIVTQFCFEAGPIIAWDKKLRAAGNRLPIVIGVPGIATIGTLVKYAHMCGIGPSITFLTKQARNVAKLLAVSAPDRLIADLAAYKASTPDCGIVGCHLYPLGGLKKTAAWAHAVLDGRFDMAADGGGFKVHANSG